jgi:HEAT repeat protein
MLAKKPECAESCRSIVHTALQDESAPAREQGIIIAMRPDIRLATEVPALLRDPEPAVRRGAMLAIGTSRELIDDDDLLHWLHDGDAEVRELCAEALRERGLREKDITMGRLISDASFLKRLEVFNYLGDDNSVDPLAWLDRLSQDPVPAVRAAAVRLALGQERSFEVDFAIRARQIATNDPDGTVRQIAQEMLRNDQR